MKYIFTLLLVSFQLSAMANTLNGAEKLNAFFDASQSFSAHFEQTSWDAAGEPIENSSGKLELQRPNRFTWNYDLPYAQQIVSDGLNIWLYDIDLEQVTVQPLHEAVVGSPASLITGAGLEDAYDIIADVAQDQGWVTLKPKLLDSDFVLVRLQVEGAELRAMELFDQFDQRTLIRFSQIQLNPSFAVDHFKFIPSEHVEVVGEAIPFQ